MSEDKDELSQALKKMVEVVVKQNIKNTDVKDLGQVVNMLAKMNDKLDNILDSLNNQLNVKLDNLTSEVTSLIIGKLNRIINELSTIQARVSSNKTGKSEKNIEQRETLVAPAPPVEIEGPMQEKSKERSKSTSQKIKIKPPSEEIQTEISRTIEESDVKTPKEKSALPEDLQIELSEIERKITDLEFQHNSGFINEDEYKEKMEELNKTREDILSKV